MIASPVRQRISFVNGNSFLLIASAAGRSIQHSTLCSCLNAGEQFQDKVLKMIPLKHLFPKGNSKRFALCSMHFAFSIRPCHFGG